MLAALVALLVLYLLFELNRWLPGGFAGGGETAWRSANLPRPDPTRVRPPAGELPRLPKEGVLVRVRAPDGSALESWTLRLGDKAVASAAGGEARVPGDADGRQGFAIEGPGSRRTEHGFAYGSEWVVHLPETAVEAKPAANPPGRAEVDVVAAEDGRPLAGAHVTVSGEAGAAEGRTDADGKAGLDVPGTRLRVRVESPGRFALARWMDPRDGAARVALVKRRAEEVRFLDAEDQSPVAVDHLRVITKQGEVRYDEGDLLGAAQDVLEMARILGDASLEDAVLEVGAPGHVVVRVPLGEAPARLLLPRGRAFDVRAADLGHHALSAGLHVEVRYVPPAGSDAPLPLEEPTPVTVRPSPDDVRVPDGTSAEVLVEADYSAPTVVRIEGREAGGRRVALLPPGARANVHVVDESGKPVVRAEVIVRGVTDGVSWRREATSDAAGVADVRDLPPGGVEVFAHTEGSAWAAATYDVGADAPPPTLRLARGLPLRLVVEDPGGLPLQGARVLVERQGGLRWVADPDALPARTDENGGLVLPDLPAGAYEVVLTLAGYRASRADGLEPGDAVHFLTLAPTR